MKFKWLLFLIIGLLIGVSTTYFAVQPSQIDITGFSVAEETACPEIIPTEATTIYTALDRDYWETIKPVLEGAEESIHIVMFNINWYVEYPDSTANLIIKALLDAKERGVDVKIVTDEFLTPQATLEYLKSKGLDIKYDDPSITTHPKLLIIDGKIVIIGSTNWSYYALDKNHEASVIIESEELAQELEVYFEEVWNES